MFDRFNDSARRAILLAGNVARHYGQDHIGTGHLLFGIVAAVGLDQAPAAAGVIAALGVEPQSVRDLILPRLGNNREPSPLRLPFTPDLKSALEHAVRSADVIGSSDIGAEHLLAGLAGNPDSTAGKVLARMGITDAAVLDAITRSAAPSPTAARTVVVYLPVGKSVFKNGGKIHPDLATAQVAHPDQEIAPFTFQLADGEFFDVGTTTPRYSSWGKFASYPDAFAAAEEFRKVQSADVKIRIMVPDVQELRGKDSLGHDVVLGRSVEYGRVSVMSRLAATVG